MKIFVHGVTFDAWLKKAGIRPVDLRLGVGIAQPKLSEYKAGREDVPSEDALRILRWAAKETKDRAEFAQATLRDYEKRMAKSTSVGLTQG